MCWSLVPINVPNQILSSEAAKNRGLITEDGNSVMSGYKHHAILYQCSASVSFLICENEAYKSSI